MMVYTEDLLKCGHEMSCKNFMMKVIEEDSRLQKQDC